MQNIYMFNFKKLFFNKKKWFKKMLSKPVFIIMALASALALALLLFFYGS